MALWCLRVEQPSHSAARTLSCWCPTHAKPVLSWVKLVSQGPAMHSVTVLGTQPPSSMKNFLS